MNGARQSVWALCLLAASSLTTCSRSKPEAISGATRTVRVGPVGGELELTADQTSVRLAVPAGALTQPVELTAKPLSTKPDGTIAPSFELLPHGTQFKKPVTIVLDASSVESVRNYPPHRVRIATRGERGWELLPTRPRGSGQFEATTRHFSVFALVGDCFVTGIGDDFPLAGCPSSSPRVKTSVPKQVSVEGGVVSLSISLFKEPLAGAVTVTVEGLQPNTKYYLRHDREVILAEETSDSIGRLAYSRSRDAFHKTVLTAVHGSLSLVQSNCTPPVGVWTPATSTCALTADIPDADVTLHEDGFTLDCRDPTTGQIHTIGSTAVRHAFGVGVFNLNGVSIKNCEFRNLDFGVSLGSASNFTIRNIGIESSPPAEGVQMFGSTAGQISQARIRNVTTGFNVQPGSNAGISSSEISDVGYGVVLFQGDNFPVRDVTVRNVATLGFAVANFPNADLQNLGALGVSPSGEGLLVYSGTTAAIKNATTVGGNSGIHIQYDALGASSIEGSSTSCASVRGVVLDGPGPFLFFHNNLFANQVQQLARFGPYPAMNLWDDRPASPTYQQGNFWGRSCPGALFDAADVLAGSTATADAFPYGAVSAWAAGGAPGCAAVGPPAPPQILSPVEDGVVRIGLPIVYGSGPPSANVEVLSQGVVVGSGAIDSCGAFAVQTTELFSNGARAITARVTVGGVTSAASPPRHFTIDLADTLAPSPPTIRFPTAGASVAEATLTVVGTAEPLSSVEIREGGLVRAAARAFADGGYAVDTSFARGAHTITATATDSSGNVSSPSSSVTFTVSGLSASAPLLGSTSKLLISAATDAPDPFVPSQGEVNLLAITGSVKRAQGAAGQQSLQAQLERQIVDANSGQLVTTLSLTSALPISTAPGQQAQPLSLELGWDGRTQTGAIAPEGTYLSVGTLSVVRNPRPGGSGSFPPDCTPTGPIDGPCKLDSISFTKTVTLLDRPRGTLIQPPPLTICSQRAEVCDGMDNNCNGLVDEGACGEEANCKCD